MMLPRIQPIIPIRRREPFDDPAWLFEFKYDGFRGLWYFDRGRGRFLSRNGNLMSRFDALADQVAASLGGGCLRHETTTGMRGMGSV